MTHQSPSSELAAALSDGVALLETSAPANSVNNVETVLKNRLSSYYSRLPNHDALNRLQHISILEDVQLLTAKEALSVVERVQKVLDFESNESHVENDVRVIQSQAPSIGTRDLAKLRTLLSLAFKWGVEPLYVRVSQAWPGATTEGDKYSKIVDLTSDSEDYLQLSAFTKSLLFLVFPQGAQGRISQTLITSAILARHVTDLLLPSIALGWLPATLSSSNIPTVHEIRPVVMRMLGLVSPAQAITSLGSILSSTSPSPPLHVRKACTSLLTKQVLRPDGVQGLCTAMFSQEEATGDEAKPEKLEQVARTLNTVPASMKAQEYFRLVFPRVVKLLTSDAPIPYRRAAAFTIYRAVVPKNGGQNHSYASSTVLSLLHGPFLGSTEQDPAPSLGPREALSSIVTLLANTEPYPIFISKMLSPIIPALYHLSFDIDQCKTADPQLKESVLGLLKSWGKIVDQNEGTRTLWSIIEGGKDCEWKFHLEGNIWKAPITQENPSLLMPGNTEAIQNADPSDFDENLFNLYPDPVHFVQLLKTFDRGDIASSIFVKLLEIYRDMKGRLDQDSMKILHKLQIILQMQKRLSEGTTSSILRKPDHLLAFIFHVLESSNMSMAGNANTRLPSDKLLEEGDSDDEAPDSEVIGPDDELIETTVTLLLSILEAEDTLSARTYPILNDIFSMLEVLALKGSSTLRSLAREARLVMTARLAGTSEVKTTDNKAEEDAQETYQRALKLLQDPILPVRAHGLLLLRQLLGSPYRKDDQVNRALVPSILSIFLQSVQDEDSYIFLNAAKGLAALVDKFGKEILQGLVHDYSRGLEGLGALNLTQHDVDIRTRIGEALSSVIKRCGNALDIYVDILVPPLFAIIRGSNIPTTLRTSSLSLLADCVDTYPLAMLPYAEDLCQALIDLLQIESVSSAHGHDHRLKPEGSNKDSAEPTSDTEPPPPPPGMDSDPTSKNSNFPPLRRAALHFLSLLVRASTKLVYDGSGISPTTFFPRATFQRASITLGYISSTDEDNVVRIMAREAKENLEQLQRSAFGL